jgi:hypothetical protein
MIKGAEQGAYKSLQESGYVVQADHRPTSFIRQLYLTRWADDCLCVVVWVGSG